MIRENKETRTNIFYIVLFQNQSFSVNIVSLFAKRYKHDSRIFQCHIFILKKNFDLKNV